MIRFFKEVPVVEKQMTLEFFSNSDQNSGKERRFILYGMPLKVNKFQKDIVVSPILPKNQWNYLPKFFPSLLKVVEWKE